MSGPRHNGEGAYPMGTARQLCAIFGSGAREEALRQLKVPTLVIHGEADPLIPPSAGRRTAELIPGAELMMVEKMGHDLPMPLWPTAHRAGSGSCVATEYLAKNSCRPAITEHGDRR